MIVVADASPLRSLIIIERTHILSGVYGQVIVPPEVASELLAEHSPIHEPLEKANFRASEQLLQSVVERDARRRAL